MAFQSYNHENIKLMKRPNTSTSSNIENRHFRYSSFATDRNSSNSNLPISSNRPTISSRNSNHVSSNLKRPVTVHGFSKTSLQSSKFYDCRPTNEPNELGTFFRFFEIDEKRPRSVSAYSSHYHQRQRQKNDELKRIEVSNINTLDIATDNNLNLNNSSETLPSNVNATELEIWFHERMAEMNLVNNNAKYKDYDFRRLDLFDQLLAKIISDTSRPNISATSNYTSLLSLIHREYQILSKFVINRNQHQDHDCHHILQQNSTLMEELKILQSQNDKCQAKCNRLEDELNENRREVTEKEKEIVALRSKVLSLDPLRDKKKKEIDSQMETMEKELKRTIEEKRLL